MYPKYDTMEDTQKCQKCRFIFSCIFCDYKTSHKSHYTKHLTTAKHEKCQKRYKMIQSAQTAQKSADFNKNNKQYICDNCNKEYLYHSGLWRHKKNCNNQLTLQTIINEVNELKSLIKTQNQPIILNKDQNIYPQTISNIQGNNNIQNNTYNNNNNTMVFLETHCKDAINMKQFLDNIKIDINQLDFMIDHNRILSISDIFQKHLSQYDIYKRPIHCTDTKRLTMFVKDNNTWHSNENGKQTITNAIEDITKIGNKIIPHWEDHNKTRMSKDDLDINYMKLVKKLNSPIDNNENIKIIKNIAISVKLDKESNMQNDTI
jgi:hypothetical protein